MAKCKALRGLGFRAKLQRVLSLVFRASGFEGLRQLSHCVLASCFKATVALAFRLASKPKPSTLYPKTLYPKSQTLNPKP